MSRRVPVRWSGVASSGVGSATAGHRGQGLVEFAIVTPVFLLLLLGMLEFGMAFTHNQTLQYATREGARTGAALANGGGPLGCSAGPPVQSPNAGNVDPQIIAAVERVLNSPGSPIANNLARVPAIRIFKADANGKEVSGGPVDIWTYNQGAGPSVDGKALDYTLSSASWGACTRQNGDPADSLGVSLTYTYPMQTGLGAILRFFGGAGWASIEMSDRTIMNLNPTNHNPT